MIVAKFVFCCWSSLQIYGFLDIIRDTTHVESSFPFFLDQPHLSLGLTGLEEGLLLLHAVLCVHGESWIGYLELLPIDNALLFWCLNHI